MTMSTKRWLFIVGLCLGGFGLTAQRADAYYGVANLEYDGEGEALTGYTGIFREPWDPSFYYWYEGACECYIYYESSVGEVGRLFKPSGSLYAAAAEQAVDYVYFALPPFVPDEDGVWTVRADHSVYHHYWEPYGIYCGYTPCEYSFTDAWSEQREVTVGCGNPTVAEMRQEYLDRPEAGFVPFCNAFRSSGGSENFSWSELNDGWSGGNEPRHNPWSMMLDNTINQLEQTRAIFNNGGIIVSSGYRCPIGNANLPGSATSSRHMRGQAIDMYAAVYGREWTEQQFNELMDAARNTNPVELFNYHRYADHHLHAAWE